MKHHSVIKLGQIEVPKVLEKQLTDLIGFKISGYESSCECDECSDKRGLKVNNFGQMIPTTQVTTPIYHVPKITAENKFNWGNESSWEALGESGQYLFNYLYEFLERNEHSVFSTDLFKLDGFSNEQVMVVQKIIDSAKFNMATVAAEFIAYVQNAYDEEGDFRPEQPE